MNDYIYCIREQALRQNDAVDFKIVIADDLDLLRNSTNSASAQAPWIVFVLGPFLDIDEAEDVESQVSGLLKKYRGAEDRLGINPLLIIEFRAWLDAQMLPIRVYEKPTRLERSLSRIGFVRNPEVSAQQQATVGHGTNQSDRSQS